MGTAVPSTARTAAPRSEVRYDERGNEVEGVFYGPDGEPAESGDSRARRTRTYDALGNLVEEAYFGKDGRPTARSDGIARLEQEYDERGRRTGQRFFGAGAARAVLRRHGGAGLRARCRRAPDRNDQPRGRRPGGPGQGGRRSIPIRLRCGRE